MCPSSLDDTLWVMTSVGGSGFHPAFVLILLGLAAGALVWWRLTFRRAMQVFCACLFLGLLWLVLGLLEWWVREDEP